MPWIFGFSVQETFHSLHQGEKQSEFLIFFGFEMEFLKAKKSRQKNFFGSKNDFMPSDKGVKGHSSKFAKTKGLPFLKSSGIICAK